MYFYVLIVNFNLFKSIFILQMEFFKGRPTKKNTRLRGLFIDFIKNFEIKKITPIFHFIKI